MRSIKKIPNTPLTYSRVLPTWKNTLTRQALYKYTTTWNKNIRALSEEGSSAVTPKRRSRAQLYKKLIEKEFRPRRMNVTLYRGLTGKNRNAFESSNRVAKPSMSSFSKNFGIAKGYANNYRYAPKNYRILVLEPGQRRRLINFANYPPMQPSHRNKEVILAPGTFVVKSRSNNGRLIFVNFKNGLA